MKQANHPKTKRVVLLGASGSIGSQTLEVLRKSPWLKLVGASVHENGAELKAIASEFSPEAVCLSGEAAMDQGDFTMPLYRGKAGLIELAQMDADIVLTAVVGLAGLEATLAAIEAGNDIALANKETLVGAGALVMAKARAKGVAIHPVDSEHSAIWQALSGYTSEDIKRLILTASGGPFFGKKKADLENISPAQALKHPNWTMGAKVTIDSASLMNKGLEVIEAHWLFDVAPEDIQVHVHPESILHSAVEFKDHSILAQLGTPDMHLPIQYALNYPHRGEAVAKSLDLFKVGSLNFYPPDLEAFPCLAMAYEALKTGGYAPLILNTADEVAVARFLREEISFLEIPAMIDFALSKYASQETLSLDGILSLDEEIRNNLSNTYDSTRRIL